MQLEKGGKETFGWVIVGEGRTIPIPPLAWERYKFQGGDRAIFIRGSKRSGGFGLTNERLLAQLSFPLAENRTLGVGRFTTDGGVCIPEHLPYELGDRLLTVFGSCHALGFITQGHIYELALQHPELAEFRREK